MLTDNINNKMPFKHNHISQKKNMKIHKKIFLTLAASLLFSVNYGNSCFADTITREKALEFQNLIKQHDGKVTLDAIRNVVPHEDLVNSIQASAIIDNNIITKIDSNVYRVKCVMEILLPVVKSHEDLFANFGDDQEARIVVDSLLKILNNDSKSALNDEVEDIKKILHDNNKNDQVYDNKEGRDNVIRDTISAILKDTYQMAQLDRIYDSSVNDQIYKSYYFGDLLTLQKDYNKLIKDIKRKDDELNDIKQEKETLAEEKGRLINDIKKLKSEIIKLKDKDPEKSDSKIQDEIQKKEDERKKKEDKVKEINDKRQQIIDQQEIKEITKIQEKIQITQAPIEAPTYTVQYIAAIQSSLVSNITSTRMKVNPYDIRTSEDKNKPIAAGSRAVGAYITPKSWDIWANGHMGNIKQDAANATSANAQTDFYGGSIGIDKVFANNSVLGLALSYGQSNTEYTSKTSTGTAVNNKWASDYYQANIYTQHNFNNNLFLQLIGGIGTYGNGTTIGNMFDFTSQEFTFGYHGNATIGYSVFGGEDSNFAITPKLSAIYYHLNIPDSIIGKPGSSTFTTLDRVDGIAGLNIKIFSSNSNANSNVKIIPELTAAVKFRLYDNVDGINADNIKLPVAQSTNPNDLSANALATPEQLFTLGGALTVTNNNFSISLHGSFDFAAQYLAAVGGISVKLSF